MLQHTAWFVLVSQNRNCTLPRVLSNCERTEQHLPHVCRTVCPGGLCLERGWVVGQCRVRISSMVCRLPVGILVRINSVAFCIAVDGESGCTKESHRLRCCKAASSSHITSWVIPSKWSSLWTQWSTLQTQNVVLVLGSMLGRFWMKQTFRSFSVLCATPLAHIFWATRFAQMLRATHCARLNARPKKHPFAACSVQHTVLGSMQGRKEKHPFAACSVQHTVLGSMQGRKKKHPFAACSLQHTVLGSMQGRKKNLCCVLSATHCAWLNARPVQHPWTNHVQHHLLYTLGTFYAPVTF